MASYVDSVLASGERIVHRASLSHWNFLLSYLISAVLIAGGIAGIAVARDQQALRVAGMIGIAIGLAVLLAAAIRRGTTELVVTDRRIITKSGLISRDTVEMNLGKVESVHVNQSLLGRLLGYGDVTVVGTGASLEPLRGIAQPLELRRKLGEVSQLRDTRAA